MNYFAQRRQSLTRELKRDGFDALVVSAPANIFYLTGFTGDSSYVVATPKHVVLVSDSRFEKQIAEECRGIEVVIRRHDKTTEEAVGDVLSRLGCKAAGVESRHATLAMVEALAAHAPKCTLAGAGARVEELRAVKDASEVEAIRASVRAAERAFAMFRAMMRGSDSEKDLADAMDHYIRRAGGQRASFAVIAAVGERGALPHAPPTSLLLSAASKLLIDWGAVLDGYHSDLTRCLRSPFPPAPTRRNKLERVGHDFRTIYELVLAAQQAAIALVREGVPARDVDAAARATIDAGGYGDFFTHGLGHGIGLETHELPRVRKNSADILQAGMVITIEPGIYIPGWGGVRIEDDVLVLRDGCTVLSTLPNDYESTLPG